MQRNCPHCGQDQVIADEDIVAPWVFTKCHSCGKLSVVRKEMIAGASSRDKPVIRGKAAAVLRKKDQIEQRRARKAARARAAETLHATAPAPADSFQRAQPERLDARQPYAIESFSTPEAEWSDSRLPPSPPPFLRRNESPIEAERLTTVPEARAGRGFDFKPFAAILVALVLVLIGLQLGVPETGPDPASAAAMERQEIPTTMSAPARPATEAPATAPIEVATEAPATAPEPRAAIATPIWTVQVAREGALLRSGPGLEYRKLGTLDLGARLLVRKWEKNWFQVELENLAPGTPGIGWIRGDLIIQAGQAGQAGQGS